MPGVEKEVTAIAAAYRRRHSTKCDVLFGSEATFRRLCHTWTAGTTTLSISPAMPGTIVREAYLMVDDRAVIRANELRSFLGDHPPAIMVLNSLFTAFVPSGAHDVDIDPLTCALTPQGFAPGPESRGQPGFTGMTSAVGVGALVGCFGSPSDDMGEEIGMRFHEELIAGQPIALALHRARLSAPQQRSNGPLGPRLHAQRIPRAGFAFGRSLGYSGLLTQRIQLGLNRPKSMPTRARAKPSPAKPRAACGIGRSLRPEFLITLGCESGGQQTGCFFDFNGLHEYTLLPIR